VAAALVGRVPELDQAFIVQAVEDLRSPVRARVVHHDELDRTGELHVQQALDRLVDGLSLVVDRHQDR
jgi:hypothetical protein